MSSLFSTAGLASASARHPWRTVGLWIAFVVAALVVSSNFGGGMTGTTDYTNNPDSKQAETLIEQRIGADPFTETIVFRSETLTVDDPAYQQAVEQTTADLIAMDHVVGSATNYYQAEAAGAPEASSLVSEDRHASIVPVTLVSNDGDALIDEAEAFVTVARGQASADLDVYAVGDLSVSETSGAISEEDLAKDLTIGLPVAGIVLVFVFGALVAAGVPLLLGIITIVVASGLIGLAANIINVNEIVSIMIIMIGLAVGIDYALFVVERYREEQRHGQPKQQAITTAGGTAGKAVFFSGFTVILALMGMFIIPISIFHSLATGAILAVLVAVAATQTLVPALLSLIGNTINWPRRTQYDQASVARQAEHDRETIHRGFWGWVTRIVMGRPVASLLIAVAILVGLASPVFDLKLGQPGIETFPTSDVKTGYEILERQFNAGVIAPVEVVVDAAAGDVTAEVDAFVARLEQDPRYGSPNVVESPGGDLTIVSAPLALEPNSQQAYSEIERLRGEVIPETFGSVASNVYVTGETASNADFNTVLSDYTPWVFVFVLGLSFVLLTLAFRSLVVPAKAIIMNLLSVGAAYGVLVGVFQKGYFADVLDVTRTESIAAWIPMFLFCVLFGLSMDYHIFLLSRIRERFDLTGNNDEAVAFGLQATSRIITGAALIMVAIFGAFAAGRLSEIEQMGLGLAVAIFLDATLVRSILVPAAMKLLGDRNWYLPSWLRWLPDVRIEGERAPQPGPDQDLVPGTIPAD